MNYETKYIINWLLRCILVIASIIACNKKLDVTDQNNPTTESYFKTAVELQNGVNAVYSRLRSAELVGREWFFTHDMRGGECACRWRTIGSSKSRVVKTTFTCTIKFCNDKCVDWFLPDD